MDRRIFGKRRLLDRYVPSWFRLPAMLALLLGAGNAIAADDYGAAPWFPYRDANPFIAAGGLPLAPPVIAPGDGWQVDTLLTASNTEILFDRAREHLVYDTEMHELRIVVTRSFGERWLARASLGATRFTPGFLDGFVADFHRTFGFDNGNRGELGRGGNRISYIDEEGDTIQLGDARGGVAPLLLDVAWRSPGPQHEWLLGGTLKFPLAHDSPLLDDRAVDVSLWAALQSTAPTRWRWGARFGVWHRGDGQLLPQRAESPVPFADGVIGWRPTPHWELAAQYQVHGPAYSSNIPLLQSAGTLTLSSAWQTRAGWTVQAGLIEDVPARRAQDITFFVGLRR